MKQHIQLQKAGLFIILLALLLPFTLGLECFVDLDPFVRYTSAPRGVCIPSSIENDQCTTWLSNPDNQTEIWGLMPERELVDGVGEVDYYTKGFGAGISLQFSKHRLYDNKTVTFNIQCGDEYIGYNVTPHFADYEEIAEGWLWTKQNIPFLIALILFLFVLIAIIIWMWRNA